MKNRSRYEVIAAILKTLEKGNGTATRTKIIYGSMLSSEQCKLYLDLIINRGLAEEVVGDKVRYKLTEGGKGYLSYYDQLNELMPLGIKEVVNEL